MRAAPDTPASGRPWVRFLVAGGVNTALTWLLYLLLLERWGHRLAYTAAFAAGIGLAYVLNRFYVFNRHTGWRSMLALPAIYLLQYAVGLGVVEVWVRHLALWPEAAPLVAVAVTLPMTFILSRAAFTR
ncbi:MAG: GtrA family protein [Polaromonas sp.]|nr:GtrA family protein [Polaromonas sp.]